MKKDNIWDKDEYCVYLHDGRGWNSKDVYIGYAKGDPRKRWYNKWGGHNYHHGKIGDALDRIPLYLWDHVILQKGLSKEEAEIWETIYILEYDSIDNGLNAILGNGLKMIGMTRAQALENREECLRRLRERLEKV